MPASDLIAAVDLGSNSFRLEICSTQGQQLTPLDYQRETVRIGNGLDDQGHLSADAMQRGWSCLQRFGQRLTQWNPSRVRAVATQTLWEAANRDAFLAHGQTLLGVPIEVISGQEEARLIYQGVALGLADTAEPHWVIDIGGRSTELIYGQGMQALRAASYPVGSVSWSMRYFADGGLRSDAFQAARTAALEILQPALMLAEDHRPQTRVHGCAGTVNAVAEALTPHGWPAGRISREGLNWLLNHILTDQATGGSLLTSLREDRKAVIGGGVSVLLAVFDLLHLQEMQHSPGGLRHGLLWQLMETGSARPESIKSSGRSSPGQSQSN